MANGILVAGFEGRRIRLSSQRCLEPRSFHRLLRHHIPGARLLIVRAIAGLAFGQDAARAAISAELGRLLGPSSGEFIKSILERSSDPTSGVTATLAGVVTVLVTPSGVFGEMRTALNTTFHAKPSDEPIFSLIRSRAASLCLVAALGFMLIVSLAASAGLSALERWSAGRPS